MRFIGVRDITEYFPHLKTSEKVVVFEVIVERWLDQNNQSNDPNWKWINRPSSKYGYKKYVQDRIETEDFIFMNCLSIGQKVVEYKGNCPYKLHAIISFDKMKDRKGA